MCVETVCETPPSWMREGTYAEYTFESNLIWFLNGTLFRFQDYAQTIFRWECVELNETYAILNVTITYIENERIIRFSDNIRVELSTRKVLDSDGIPVGRTQLWLPLYPNVGDTYIMFDDPLLVGEVTEVGAGWSGTPQGAQNIFIVEGYGAIGGWWSVFSGFYDIDTGVGIDLSLRYEPLLVALGISDAGRSGLIYFTDTNINLGPRNIFPEFFFALLYSSPVLVFLVIFILIHRRRKRKAYKK